MSSYQAFAQFYDYLTENVDYKVRSEYISNFFSSDKENQSVLDLACGTGSLSKHLADKGYKVIGIDLSSDMLTVAESKNILNATFICTNMTDFKLAEKVDNCVCCLDSVNHLTSIEDVKKCFECVAKSLVSGGIFVFDVNTVYKHNFILADNTFAFDEEDFFLCWDNETVGDNTVRILLDFFVYNGSSYDRFSEEFFEKAYEIDEIKEALVDFDVIGIYDELTNEPPKKDSERVYFVCKRK